jgi:isoquinoline 1-oxidoreductase subunit beta
LSTLNACAKRCDLKQAAGHHPVLDDEDKQSNFYDYIVPRNRDVPPMHVEVIQTDNRPTGVGQMATPLITPAVSNAIMALAGKRLRHAPFTEERVKKAIG